MGRARILEGLVAASVLLCVVAAAGLAGRWLMELAL